MFADLLDRVNATAIDRLSLGEGLTLNGQPVSADFTEVYDKGYLEGVSASGSRPSLMLLTKHVPADVVGMPVTANGQSYTVGEHLPDSMGLSVLVLDLDLTAPVDAP